MQTYLLFVQGDTPNNWYGANSTQKRLLRKHGGIVQLRGNAECPSPAIFETPDKMVRYNEDGVWIISRSGKWRRVISRLLPAHQGASYEIPPLYDE